MARAEWNSLMAVAGLPPEVEQNARGQVWALGLRAADTVAMLAKMETAAQAVSDHHLPLTRLGKGRSAVVVGGEIEITVKNAANIGTNVMTTIPNTGNLANSIREAKQDMERLALNIFRRHYDVSTDPSRQEEIVANLGIRAHPDHPYKLVPLFRTARGRLVYLERHDESGRSVLAPYPRP